MAWSAAIFMSRFVSLCLYTCSEVYCDEVSAMLIALAKVCSHQSSGWAPLSARS